jgi:hypothetical protein
VPLFGAAPPRPSFVVGFEGVGAVIYKITNKKRIYGVFETALFSGRFRKVVVCHSKKRLSEILLKQRNFDWYKMESV